MVSEEKYDNEKREDNEPRSTYKHQQQLDHLVTSNKQRVYFHGIRLDRRVCIDSSLSAFELVVLILLSLLSWY